MIQIKTSFKLKDVYADVGSTNDKVISLTKILGQTGYNVKELYLAGKDPGKIVLFENRFNQALKTLVKISKQYKFEIDGGIEIGRGEQVSIENLTIYNYEKMIQEHGKKIYFRIPMSGNYNKEKINMVIEGKYN